LVDALAAAAEQAVNGMTAALNKGAQGQLADMVRELEELRRNTFATFHQEEGFIACFDDRCAIGLGRQG
jgi:hypothetical protein